MTQNPDDASEIGFTAPRAEVRGHTAYDRPAGVIVRILASLIDLAWVLALYCFGVKVLNLSPIPGPPAVLLIAIALGALWLAQQLLLGGTVGQLVWRLRVLDDDRKRLGWPQGPASFLRACLRARTCQHERLQLQSASTGIFLTLVTLAGAAWIGREALWKHPFLIEARVWSIPAFVPPAAAGADWEISPFYYALGPWPVRFGGKPVFFTLPYEKGPPAHFVGHIVARWEMPDVKLTLEGPKTPAGSPLPEALRSCLTRSWSNPGCLALRERVLMRHVQELRAIAPRDWSLRWFEVDNPALPPEERPRGFYLSGWNDLRGQDRFVLVNAQGIEQAVILDRSRTAGGDAAKELFENALAAQRVSGELGPGRAWVDRRLGDTRLEEAKALENSTEWLARFAQIQTLLLAKISIDPGSYESFYHLGGTAHLLAQKAFQTRDAELSAAAKPLIQSAYQYARDILPSDPHTAMLEGLWLDAKKF